MIAPVASTLKSASTSSVVEQRHRRGQTSDAPHWFSALVKACESATMPSGTACPVAFSYDLSIASRQAYRSIARRQELPAQLLDMAIRLSDVASLVEPWRELISSTRGAQRGDVIPIARQASRSHPPRGAAFLALEHP